MRFVAVSGGPYAELERAMLALDSCELEAVLGSARFVPHDLNRRGLALARQVSLSTASLLIGSVQPGCILGGLRFRSTAI